jgi:hypothetical protein
MRILKWIGAVIAGVVVRDDTTWYFHYAPRSPAGPEN